MLSVDLPSPKASLSEMSLLMPAAPPIPGFDGTVIRPSDEGYDEARRVYNGMIDRYPALIARCTTIADVIAALAFGRANELPIAVRGGGHSAPGFGVVDGGLVIDVRPMNEVHVDPLRRIAWVQGGAVWAELDAATQEHGLAVTGGRVSSTGVTGFTLGSGSGWLERKMGLAADSLRAARVVTADGVVVTASPTRNPDLFWALRGGGGNFGIVVELEFALQPVGPIVLGGMLAWPRDRAPEIARAYRAMMTGAPDSLGGGLALVTAPPLPFVPEALQGEPVVAAIVLYTGDPERGAEHIAALRALEPALDAVQPMPYAALQQMMDPNHPDTLRNYYKSGFVDTLSDAALDTIIAAANAAPSPTSAVLLLPLGGAFARMDGMATALGHRDAGWGYQALSTWADAADDTANIAWARSFAAAVEPWARPAGFPNFIADGGDAEMAVAYGAERLVQLRAAKDRWDQQNVFRHNHNIRPTDSNPVGR
jgi:FAD/FMN-containing dehydrogenase